MQYESIILELMGRIKVLETSCEQMQQQIQQLCQRLEQVEQAPAVGTDRAVVAEEKKITDAMVLACYTQGVRLFQTQQSGVRPVAEAIQKQTGMNRSSAILYLYAISGMLTGKSYKRGINCEATEQYFNWILRDFGPAYLQRAINATREHVAYRRMCGYPVDKIDMLCDRYQKKISKDPA